MNYDDDILFYDAKSLIFEEIETLIDILKDYLETDQNNIENYK